jgi:hypothetical protein
MKPGKEQSRRPCSADQMGADGGAVYTMNENSRQIVANNVSFRESQIQKPYLATAIRAGG